MRVLHVLAETGWSGGETQLDFLVRHLAANGHQNHLMLPPAARFSETATALQLPVHTVDLRRPWLKAARRHLRDTVRSVQPDVLHFGCGRSLLWGGLFALGLPVPLRITTRRIDYPIGRFWRGPRYRKLVDHVVANCLNVQDRVLAAGVPHDRVSVVHEGIDLAPWLGIRDDRAGARQRLHVPASALVISCAAVLRPRKGQRDLLEAFAKIQRRHPDALLILAGGGSDLERLKQRVQQLGLDHSVRVPGPLRPIRDLYAASDLFCMPSYNEGLANACMEAGAAGLPQIVSTAGGLPEIVADGETGLVRPPGQVEQWAEALSELLSDEARRERMGAAGAARVAALFPWRRMAENMESLFERLLKTKHG